MRLFRFEKIKFGGGLIYLSVMCGSIENDPINHFSASMAATVPTNAIAVAMIHW